MATTPNGLVYPAESDSSDVAYWMSQLASSADTLFKSRPAAYGTAQSLSGGVPGTPAFLFQAGTGVYTTNSSGGTSVGFPTSFPHGLLYFGAVLGDASSGSSAFGPPSNIFSQGNPAFQGIYINNAASATVRLTWLAIGW